MKKRGIRNVLAITIILLVSGHTLASEAICTNFLDKLHQRYESGTKFQMGWVDALSELSKFGNQAPDVNRFQKATRELAASFEQYRSDDDKLQQLWRANRKSIQLPKNLLAELNENNAENFSQFHRLIGELGMFSQTIRVDSFTLYANESWANSGMTVRNSDLAWIDATGSWSMKSSREMADWRGYPDPQGSPYGLIQQAPLGALLYRVRGSSSIAGFPVPDTKYAMIIDSGRLEFMANDTDLSNNLGQLDLKIVVFNWEHLNQVLSSIQKLSRQR